MEAEADEDTIDDVDEEVEEKVHDIGTKSELIENHSKVFVIYIYIVLVPALLCLIYPCYVL
jgi:hypothetical protein